MLEERRLLTGINWFESFDEVPRIPLDALEESVNQPRVQHGPEFVGPTELIGSEWIVQFRRESIRGITHLQQLEGILGGSQASFAVISGLGTPGLVLLRAFSVTEELAGQSLSSNASVDSFSLNRIVVGQSTLPNESDLLSGLLPGLDKVGIRDAWDVTRGASQIVVGVLDTGIDATHPDLYLNMWLNQGELPPKFLDGDGPKLVDIDGDGLITFYDLNNVTVSTTAPFNLTFGGWETGPNSSFLRDRNNNGRIEAEDLLQDPNWADGRDTDDNGFFDDFFGVNFRASDNDEILSNNPTDQLGHGTHVAGTIGATGNNSTGVVGVNWRTSLMSLRILDNNNQGDTGAAIRAVNYARQMREQRHSDSTGRLTQGADVRVLNNSWGQPGGYEASLESVIRESGVAGILFVAAAGNGNILGQGVNNDRTPFYPAAYASENVMAVAAVDGQDQLASFSNFGKNSVDLLAPGVGIRSTLPGGSYGLANGTSMATPHVAGAAALIWAANPEAALSEVQDAILSTVHVTPDSIANVASGGRLDVAAAINADVFAPSARIVSKHDITTAGGTVAEIVVEFSHRSGIDISTLDGDELTVKRQWGAADPVSVTLKPGSVTRNNKTATASYIIAAPGGAWDVSDYGAYSIEMSEHSIISLSGKEAHARIVGQFNVKIQDPSVIYVSSIADGLGEGSLRDAIIAANATGQPRTIILESGVYSMSIPFQPDPQLVLPSPSMLQLAVINSPADQRWSNATSGDFDVTGSITIVGNQNDFTIIDAGGLDRAFKVHPGGNLQLERVTVTGGISPAGQGGGGILSWGDLTLRDAIVRDNVASGLYGGGAAIWGGHVDAQRSWFDKNTAKLGGGIYLAVDTSSNLERSTFSNNTGGAVESDSSGQSNVSNSTFSGNAGGNGAINHTMQNLGSQAATISADGTTVGFSSFLSGMLADTSTGVLSSFSNGYRFGDKDPFVNDDTFSLSADGRFVAFSSPQTNLVPGDTNDIRDIFVLDRVTRLIDRVSVASNGTQASDVSDLPSISADGRMVAFRSAASNLVPNDTNGVPDIFVFDRQTRSIERVNVTSSGAQANNGVPGNNSNYLFDGLMISADGQSVAFSSWATNLVTGDTNRTQDVFVFNRSNRTVERVSVGNNEVEGGFGHFSRSPSISADGRFVAFISIASLAPGDTFRTEDTFVFDRINRTVERVFVTLESGEVPIPSNPAISGDGRFVAFEATDLYVYDRTEHVYERVSAASSAPSISHDGRYVAFRSTNSNLVPGDTNGVSDVFVYDRSLHQMKSPSLIPAQRLVASQVSIVDTTSAPSAVNFGVQLSDVLLYNPAVSRPLPGEEKLGELTRQGFLPPVRPLQRGNPAINSGSAASVNTIDQLGNLRAVPDLGAVEAVTANISGRIYVDLNNNQGYDAGEPTQTDARLRLVSNRIESEPVVNAAGAFLVNDLQPGATSIDIIVPENYSLAFPAIRTVPPTLGAGYLQEYAVSENGAVTAFTSSVTNLVPGDTNGRQDVFVYDSNSNNVQRVSVANDASQANNNSGSFQGVSLSLDGRYVAFSSDASNLVPNDTNARTDIFVFDRVRQSIERVSVASNGSQANEDSRHPSISADGRYVTFASFASNLVSTDVSRDMDVFIYDRSTRTIELVPRDIGFVQSFETPSISSNGRFIAYESHESSFFSQIEVYDRVERTTQTVSLTLRGNTGAGRSLDPKISPDGRYVVYTSDAASLVADDTNGLADIFVYDMLELTTDRVNVSTTGAQAIKPSSNGSISADGRFIAFSSPSANLVPNDLNGRDDVFVYDRKVAQLARVSVAPSGVEGNNFSLRPAISPDGRSVTFSSLATNLVSNAGNGELYVTANPLVGTARAFTTYEGDFITGMDFGLIPNPGSISGRLFSDTTILNGVFDAGETALVGMLVYQDVNGNGVLDQGERSTTTDSQGHFQLTGLPGDHQLQLRALGPTGFEQVSPRTGNATDLSLFLPAGGALIDRDFAFRPVQTTGQSRNSTVSGRMYEDRDGNGGFDPSADTALPGQQVYLDIANFGVRDANEPRTLTDSEGRYVFSDLGSQNVAVSTIVDTSYAHVNPLGNSFAIDQKPLFGTVTPFRNPQAVGSGDFNADGFLDVAVLLGEGNKLSIRFNNGVGGFLTSEVDIDLGAEGAGPTSLVVGQFDNQAGLDVAITANFAGNVIVLLNYDPARKQFGSKAAIPVGTEPIELVSGNYTSTKPDLVVVNKGNSTAPGSVRFLRNNGSGVFSAAPPVATGGVSPVGIVAGNFVGDEALDIAVVHILPQDATSPFGGVTILRGDGQGNLTKENAYYRVQATPTDIVAADFNGDGRSDLAVPNFSSNTISILIGQADGSFSSQANLLGTARGAIDLAATDINSDGRIDLIVGNLLDHNISIFRNVTTSAGGDSRFEPLENIGLAQFTLAQRMPLVVGNFDQDSSGPGGSGTQDIVAVIQSDGNSLLNVLKNHLVNGAHRVALTGSNSASGLDFIVRPIAFPPKMDAINSPAPLLEDAAQQTVALTGIAKGRAGGPALRFNATSSNPQLIAAAIVEYTEPSNQAILRFNPVQDASGTSTIVVSLHDAGADQVFDTADDTQLSRSFTVTVVAVNDSPTFTLPSSRIVNATEDAGDQSVSIFTSNITSGGGPFESNQSLSPFTVTVDRPSLFTNVPTIDREGRLSFRPAANAAGSTLVTVTLKDNGGTSVGGNDTRTEVFVLNILPVNDSPTFTLGGSLSVNADAGARALLGFATNFNPGGGSDEASQKISEFVVTTNQPTLFAVQPQISNSGTLSFTPSANQSGTATVTARVRDDGGVLDGGVNLSPVLSFTITISPPIDAKKPLPVLSTSVPILTNRTSFEVDVDFGESVNGFEIGDVLVSGGAAANLHAHGNGRFAFTVTSSADGLVTVAIPAGVAEDSAGNKNIASLLLTRTIDSRPPQPIITTASSSTTSDRFIDAQINFGEPVSGFSSENLILMNVSIESFTALSENIFDLRVKALNDGVVTLGLNSEAARDRAGNYSSSSNVLAIAVDTGGVTFVPSLSSPTPPITGSSLLDVTVNFGRAVAGFELSDLVLSNAVPVSLDDRGNGLFRVQVRAAAEGPLSLSLPAGSVTDAQGRSNAAALPLAFTYFDPSNTDFGDAPTASQTGFVSSYPTLLANNGARHKINGLFLGTGVDAELNGQPGLLSNGDNTNEVSTQRGIEFVVTPVADPTVSTLTTLHVISSLAGKLDAWIDFNRDGDWNDVGEQVFTSRSVSPGSQFLPVEIPGGASAGETYARFRLSSAGGLLPSGPALDGEVEDYLVVLADGGRGANVQVFNAAVTSGEMLIDGNLLRIWNGATEIFHAPAANIATLDVLHSNETSQLSITEPLTILGGKILFPSDKPGAVLACNSPLLAIHGLPLRGIDLVDLSDSNATQLQLATTDVQQLSTSNALHVILGAEDQLQASTDWRLLRAELQANQFVPVWQSGQSLLTIQSTTPWNNLLNAMDVDGSGLIVPLDALLVINAINAQQIVGSGAQFLPANQLKLEDFLFYDVNRDGRLTAIDALLVIDHLNRPAGSGEGGEESLGRQDSVMPPTIDKPKSEEVRRSIIRDLALLELINTESN